MWMGVLFIEFSNHRTQKKENLNPPLNENQ